jgi:hypothetical protein
MGVATTVSSSPFTALANALFTCIVSEWTWHGGLTLRMRIVCALSLAAPSPSHPLPCAHPVVHPHMHPHSPGLPRLFVPTPTLVCAPCTRLYQYPAPAHARSHRTLAHLYPPGRVCTLLDTTIPANKE